MSEQQMKEYSELYLRGFTNLSQHGFKLAGLNKVRQRYGLEPLKASMVNNYRRDYIKNHFSKEEIYDQIYQCLATGRVAERRYDINGLELLDCAFRRVYVKPFKQLIGTAKFKKISEKLRVNKMVETQTKQYGGVGLNNKEALTKSLITKNIQLHKDLKEYFETKHASNYITHCLSKYELNTYMDLANHFGVDDVICQYGVYPKDDRYPFDCDFYIKSLDLFIELNYHFSHKDHWFDPNSTDDANQVNEWKTRANNDVHYSKTLITWTQRDVNRRLYARKNKLNYLVFWHPRGKDSDYMIWKNEYNYDFDKFIKNHPQNTY